MAYLPNEQGFVIQTFRNSIELSLQQIGSALQDTVTVQSGLTGNRAQVTRLLAATNARKINGRAEPIIQDEIQSDSRWILPTDYRSSNLIDTFSQLRDGVNPQGAIVQNVVAALNRKKDEEIIKGIFSPNFTGVNGTDVVNFDPNQVVPVTVGASAPTGLNIQKIIQARKILQRNYALSDGYMPTIVCDSEQIANLLNDELVVSGMYQNTKVLTNGELTQVVGVNIEHSEFLPIDANGYRRNPMYVKTGVVLGMWQDMIISIDQRLDLEGLPYQTYAMLTMGATRTQEGKVVEIKNLESTLV